MASTNAPGRSAGIPEGYRAVPIHDCRSGPLRICVLVRQIPDPVAGHFVLLRDLHDALVYLGCVTDAGDRVREWIEIWVQNVDGLEASLPTYREAFSNHFLDERWRSYADGLRSVEPDFFLETGWESAHPLPTLLDLSKAEAVNPGGKDPAARWELCRDDALLQAAGLPAYKSSLFRYLY